MKRYTVFYMQRIFITKPQPGLEIRAEPLPQPIRAATPIAALRAAKLAYPHIERHLAIGDYRAA